MIILDIFFILIMVEHIIDGAVRTEMSGVMMDLN